MDQILDALYTGWPMRASQQHIPQFAYQQPVIAMSIDQYNLYQIDKGLCQATINQLIQFP
jgi:hypothetical protein